MKRVFRLAASLFIWAGASLSVLCAADPLDPPVAVTQAHYVATVEDDLARIEASLQIPLPDEETSVEIPLDFGEAVVETGGGRPAGENLFLHAVGDGRYALQISGAGPQTVQLTLHVPVRSLEMQTGGKLEITGPPTADTTLDLTIPAADRLVVFEPFAVPLPLEEAEQAPGQTRRKVRFGAISTFSARWFAEPPERPAEPELSAAVEEPQPEPLVDVTNHLQVAIGADFVHSDAELTFRVLQGKLQRIRIAVPPGHRILDVTSPNTVIKSWNIEQQEKRQVVNMEFTAPVAESVSVEVHTEADPSDEDLALLGMPPEETTRGIHALGVNRESGMLRLTNLTSAVLEVIRQEGVVEVDESGAPLHQPKDRIRHFRFYNSGAELILARTRRQPAVQSDPVIEETQVAIDVRSATDVSPATYACGYQIRPGRAGTLRVELPVGAQEPVAFLNGRSVSVSAAEEEDSIRLEIPLPAEADTTAPLIVLLRFETPLGPAPFETRLGKLQLPLPEAELANIPSSKPDELEVAVRVPNRFALIGPADSFRLKSGPDRSLLLRPRRGRTPNGEDAENAGDAGVLIRGGNVYRYTGGNNSTEFVVSWCDMPFAAWALSLPLFLIACVLGRTSWRNRLGVLFVGGLAAVLLALLYPDWVYHGWLAARYGLAAMILWWLIRALPDQRWRREAAEQPAAHAAPAIAASSTPPIVPPPAAAKPAPSGGKS